MLGKLEETIGCEWSVVLCNLVARGQVWIKVVLSVKRRAWMNVAIQRDGSA